MPSKTVGEGAASVTDMGGGRMGILRGVDIGPVTCDTTKYKTMIVGLVRWLKG